MSLLLSTVLVASALALQGLEYNISDSGNWKEYSPDHRHLGALAKMPDTKLIWRRDLDSALVEVADLAPPGSTGGGGGIMHSVCYLFTGRAGAYARWSPDSQFLVITTTSSGGHSPWHFDSFVYHAQDRSLRYLDAQIGCVVRPQFQFIGPHTVRMQIGADAADGIDLDHPKPADVDLAQRFQTLEKLKVYAESGLSD